MNPLLQQPNAKGAKDSQRTQKEEATVDWTHEIIGAAVEVQRVLGVGLLESAYAAAFEVELARSGLHFQREVPVHGRYKDAGGIQRLVNKL